MTTIENTVLMEHPWRQRVLALLPEANIVARIPDDFPEWEFIDTEIAKLGSLSHEQVDIAALQNGCLRLLESECKDMRIMVHLLRTLQHGGEPSNIALASTLLVDYVSHLGSQAWPQDSKLRHRLLLQVIKRFASSAGHFCQQADAHSRELVRNGLLQLQKLFESTDPALANEVAHLIPQFGQVVAEKVDMPAPQSQSNSSAASHTVQNAATSLMPKVEIQHDSDRVWKQTLLKVAELLCENQPDDPIGYSLRRHAIWYTLKTAPLCKDGRITQLAAVSHDRVADYRTALANAGLPLWQQIETSITLAPYWFDGHFLSAQIARQLGYSAVAESIRQSVQRLLEKIPALNAMTFSDGTPFIGDDTRQWLEEKQKNTEISAGSYENVWAQYRENGLSAALKQLENQQSREQEPREQFYNQLTIAQLLMEAGMTTLSNQHFENLWRNSHGVTLAEWEPSLLSQLEEHVAERTVVTAEESVS